MDDLNLAVIIAQIINFSIIFFIFYYFLWSKIVKIIEERRVKLENLDNSDDVVREKIKEAEEEAKKIIEEARIDALAIQKNADDLSKRNTEQKVKEAEMKAEWILSWAMRNIEKERLSMISVMKNKVLDLSLKINTKVFNNKDNNKDFISKEVNSIKL